MRRTLSGFTIAAALLFLLLLTPLKASAYSVLAHEAMVDEVWDDLLAPMLRRKYPDISTPELRESRAYAYGGSLIHDLGYYPFGSRVFSNLVHYVRSGDFVEALIRESRDANEYAFALGALAHCQAINAHYALRAVPLETDRKWRKQEREAARRLAALNATQSVVRGTAQPR